jgi:hypothetical protein
VANRFWSGIAGVGALLGGVAWLVKSTWILAGRAQPFLLFEVAPLFFAVTVTSLGLASDGVGTHRRAAVLALGCIGAITATVAATTEIAGNLWGPSIAVAVLAVVAGLLLFDRRRSPTDRLAWWIGAVLLPAVLLGGVLTVVEERLLELHWLSSPPFGSGLEDSSCARRRRGRHAEGSAFARASLSSRSASGTSAAQPCCDRRPVINASLKIRRYAVQLR